MQYGFPLLLEEELNSETWLLTKYRKELNRTEPYADMMLKVNIRRGHRYYSHIYYEDGKRVFAYLGKKNHPLVQTILYRHYLECVTANLESNIKEMERLRDKYRPIDPNRIRETLPKAYQFDDPRCFELAGTVDEEAWKQMLYRSSKSHPEHLTQIAADGAFVRSKSEVIITNALLSYGLPIRHEEERIFDGVPIAPDFIIYSQKLQQEIIWEHFGRMDDPDYRALYRKKMGAFAAAGYYPYVNLITTFDDAEGNIDSRKIEEIIREFFL